MSDIKVCLIAPEFLPNWGGVGTYCIELARAIADKVEFHVATLEREDRRRAVYSRDDMLDFFNDKIEVHVLGKYDANDTFFYNAKMQMAVYKKLPSIITENDIDLVHSNFPHMPDILLKLSEKVDIPCVTTVHTTIEGQKDGIRASHLNFFQMDLSEKCTLLMYPILKLAENLYLKRARNLITVSNWMEDMIKKNYPFITNLCVVHNGVDVEKFIPNNSSFDLQKDVSDPVILFTSRLTATKGVHYLIYAIPKILRRNREAHFVFAGAGPKEKWINLLKRMKVDEKFYTFLGYVDYQELPMLYAKANIFVVPSLYENLPLRILEAMSCESAVVASNICAIPEAILNRKNGLLIPPGSVSDLVDCLLTLLEDEGLRKRLGRNARRTAIERFSWDVIATKMLRTYEEIVCD